MIVPPGTIVLWSGAIVDIPDGWIICDGTLSTPNLTDRFVLGGSPGNPPGGTGGDANHTHTFTSDGHFHTHPVGTSLASGATHDKDTTVETDSGTTDPASNIPPWYALAYIMKT